VCSGHEPCARGHSLQPSPNAFDLLFVVFSALAECMSFYSELPQIVLSSGWICSLVPMLTALKGLPSALRCILTLLLLFRHCNI